MEMTSEPKDWYTRLHDSNKLNYRSAILSKKETAKNSPFGQRLGLLQRNPNIIGSDYKRNLSLCILLEIIRQSAGVSGA